MNEPLKDCCGNAIYTYKKNKALLELQEVVRFDTDLGKHERELMKSFLEGMKVEQISFCDNENLINELKEALIWCSGSADFGECGKARKGWLKIEHLIKT